MKKYGRGRQVTNDSIKRRMPIVCWITKAADTLSVFCSVAFSRQQWLRERFSMLRYTYIA